MFRLRPHATVLEINFKHPTFPRMMIMVMLMMTWIRESLDV